MIKNENSKLQQINEGSHIDGVIADDNEFGLTADDLRDIEEELYEMNHRSKNWGVFDDD